MKSRKRTPEELANVVLEYMEKYPDTNRHKIKKATDISEDRLQKLEDMGLVKLPEKIKKGANTPWKVYKT